MSASQTLSDLAAQHNMLADCSSVNNAPSNNNALKKEDNSAVSSPVAAPLVYNMTHGVSGHQYIDPHGRQFAQDSQNHGYSGEHPPDQRFQVNNPPPQQQQPPPQPTHSTQQQPFNPSVPNANFQQQQRDTNQQQQPAQFVQSSPQTFATSTSPAVSVSSAGGNAPSQIVFPGQPLERNNTEDGKKNSRTRESPSNVSGDEISQTQKIEKKLLVAADALAEAISKADLERALSMPKYAANASSSGGVSKEPGEVQQDDEEVKCDICDRLYSSAKHLKRHLRTHQEYRPYKCDACSKSFFDLNKLKRHHVTHTGLKPYACHICDQKLSRPEHLKRHILTHSEMKPYKCSICEFSARRNDSVKTHIRTKHPGLDVPILNLSNALLTSLQSLNKNEVILTPESELNNQTDNPQGLLKVRLAPPPVPNPNKKKSKKKKKVKTEPGEVPVSVAAAPDPAPTPSGSQANTQATTHQVAAVTEAAPPSGINNAVLVPPPGQTAVMVGHPLLTMSTSIPTLAVPPQMTPTPTQTQGSPIATTATTAASTTSSDAGESPNKKVKTEGKSSCSGGQPLMPPTSWAADTVRMSTAAMNQLQWDGNVNMPGLQFQNLMSAATSVRPPAMVFTDRIPMASQGEQQTMTMPMTMTFPQQQQLMATSSTAGLTSPIKQEPINMMSVAAAPHGQMMGPQQIGFMQSSFGASGMPTQVSLSPYFMNAMPAQLPSRMYLNGLPNRMKTNNRR